MPNASRIDPNGLYRLKSIVRSKSGPPPLIDVAAATWWAGVKSGRFPQPVRNGSMTFWRGSDLLALVEHMSGVVES
ncbi:transcriptional regulator, AlpA family [Humidesulfovibrio mexicanus]|uniref:Transcriptional regulator, AlpA family n=1 Tax=Humidesulfovibrio mexicanus TaxID=147047 RepID=A0A239B5N9_9BACT|nr:transcriptional regulator, AlpA family [Humidesulfovibrio mexicanus]